MADILGGFTETADATEETQKICDQVRNQVEEKTKKVYEEFKAIKYRSQSVAGTNFLIKVHVGGPSYLHLKVHQKLPCDGGEILLLDVQEDRQLTSLLKTTDLVTMAGIHGGYGKTKDATEDTQMICDQVKHRVEEKTKKKYVDFKAVEYRDWLNARYGLTLHLLIKVHVGEMNYIHLCVIKVLADEGRIELSDVQEQKSKDDPLVPIN